MEKKEIIQIIYLILMVFIIVLMLVTISILIKNKNIIMSDPLVYGMETHNFQSCQCIDYEGRGWYSYEGGFINKNPEELTRGEF